MTAPIHVPVLQREVIALLAMDRSPWCYADATAGFGGHAAAMAERLGAPGTVILNDMDPGNLEAARVCVSAVPGVEVRAIHGNFADLARAVEASGAGPVDMLLADLGFASNQVDDPARGLSFRNDGPLDMRLDPSLEMTAGEIVNSWPEADLADLIRRYGEDPRARRIASAIVARRPLERTGQLADTIREAVGRSHGGIDAATLTFQALRIVVNDELGSLERLLGSIERDAGSASRRWLAPGARIGIISFHSLEDRLVKRSFGQLIDAGVAQRVTRKPVVAQPDEVAENPRSRSAKLRVIALP